jgi:hypothetical protein
MDMVDESPRDISEILSDPTVLDEAAEEAAQDAIQRHKQMGLPLAVWRNGAVAWVTPEELQEENGAGRELER